MPDMLTMRARTQLQVALGPYFPQFEHNLAQTVQEATWSMGITVGRPHPQADASVLLECTTLSGEPALLRVSADPSSIEREATGLRVWSARDLAPELLAVNAAKGVLLVKKASGNSLAEELISSNENERVASLLSRLHECPVPEHAKLPSVESFMLSRLQGAMMALPHFPDVPVTMSDLHAAVSLVERLGTSAHPRVMLHGDLSSDRFIKVQGGALQVVSPKSLVGDAAYDIATYAIRKDPTTAPLVAHTLALFLQVEEQRVQWWLRVLGPDLALLGRVYSQGTSAQWAAMAALAHQQ